MCVYHGKCADGFTAAWVVREYFKTKPQYQVQFFPGFYGENPPEVDKDTYVVLVDFSYKADVLKSLAKQCRGVLVLDHHETAKQDMAEFKKIDLHSDGCDDVWNKFKHDCEYDIIEDTIHSSSSIYTHFDMKKSGARIAWDFFFGGTVPKLILHVEDRDLWKFAIPFTREIQASVFSYHYTFENWDMLMSADVDRLVTEGQAIERKHFKDIEELSDTRMIRTLNIGGHVVPASNVPYTLSSDMGALLGANQPFAACYMDSCDQIVFSLRSSPDGMDVSQIAKMYGGGGHIHASGFRLPRDVNKCNDLQKSLLEQLKGV